MEGDPPWLTELARSEWNISADELWDDRPNLGRARYAGAVGEVGTLVWDPPERLGLTFPVLRGMLDAYADRKRRELHEQGSVAAIAAHDPGQLKQFERPVPKGKTVDRIGE